jgi:transposase InsO family protein
MPWIEVKPMDQKVLFIADWLRGVSSVSDLCDVYNVSRKTGYKWLKRYGQFGIDGLHEASRKPHCSPQKTPYPVRQAILSLRTCGGMILGPKKIQVLLKKRFPNESPPSKTTIYNILHAEGVVSKRRRKQRVAPFPKPFAPERQVNDVWSADFKGQFRLKNREYCYPLTVMDHHSRYLLCCQGMAGPRFRETQAAFERLFEKYGLPQRIRTDNGVPFASKAAGGLSRLSIWWITLGILPERIDPGKPQQNGRHERMHRTLKQAATRPPEQSFRSQQKRFDLFCESYNCERPHEALEQQTPTSCYQSSERAYTITPEPLTYPEYFAVRRVQSNGTASIRNNMVYITHLLKGYDIGLNEIEQGVWDAYFGPVRLGRFDEREAKSKSVSYLSLKSVTHVP